MICHIWEPSLTPHSSAAAEEKAGHNKAGRLGGASRLEGGRLRNRITRSGWRRVNALTSVPPSGSSSGCQSCAGSYSLGSVLAGSDRRPLIEIAGSLLDKR